MTVSHHLSKHLEFCQKYSAAHYIFNSLLSVWISLVKHHRFCLIYLIHETSTRRKSLYSTIIWINNHIGWFSCQMWHCYLLLCHKKHEGKWNCLVTCVMGKSLLLSSRQIKCKLNKTYITQYASRYRCKKEYRWTLPKLVGIHIVASTLEIRWQESKSWWSSWAWQCTITYLPK